MGKTNLRTWYRGDAKYRSERENFVSDPPDALRFTDTDRKLRRRLAQESFIPGTTDEEMRRHLLNQLDRNDRLTKAERSLARKILKDRRKGT